MEYLVTFAKGKTIRVHSDSERLARRHAEIIVNNADARGRDATLAEQAYKDAGEVVSVEPVS